LHFTTLLWLDHFFGLSEMLKDVVKRPFITFGFIAFVMLLLFAAQTRTNGDPSARRQALAMAASQHLSDRDARILHFL